MAYRTVLVLILSNPGLAEFSFPTISFFLWEKKESKNRKEVGFNQQPLTFALRLPSAYTLAFNSKNFPVATHRVYLFVVTEHWDFQFNCCAC